MYIAGCSPPKDLYNKYAENAKITATNKRTTSRGFPGPNSARIVKEDAGKDEAGDGF